MLFWTYSLDDPSRDLDTTLSPYSIPFSLQHHQHSLLSITTSIFTSLPSLSSPALHHSTLSSRPPMLSPVAPNPALPSFLLFQHPVLPCFVPSCSILPRPALPFKFLFSHALSVLPYPVLFYPALSCSAQTYPTPSCLVLPCPTLPSTTCSTLPFCPLPPVCHLMQT